MIATRSKSAKANKRSKTSCNVDAKLGTNPALISEIKLNAAPNTRSVDHTQSTTIKADISDAAIKRESESFAFNVAEGATFESSIKDGDGVVIDGEAFQEKSAPEASLYDAENIKFSLVNSSNPDYKSVEDAELTFDAVQVNCIDMNDILEGDNDDAIEGTHVFLSDYNCMTCTSTFPDEESLSTHVESCAATRAKKKRGRKPRDPNRQYECWVCGKRWRYQSLLTIHLRSHTKVKPFVCTLCGAGYSYMRMLQIHERKHSGEKPFVCGVCHKGFADKSIMKMHEKTHNNRTEYICSVCGLGFNTPHGLNSHYTSHSADRPYRCETCGMQFKTRGCHRVHQRRHIPRERNLKCEICDRLFADATVLKQHSETHFREKTFQCDECGKRFLRQYNLKVHTRIHTGLKPYACSSCDRSFTQLAGLKSHEKTHTTSNHAASRIIPLKTSQHPPTTPNIICFIR